MDSKPLFETTEHNNVKEIIYSSVEKYPENIAFTIKHKDEKEISYENVTYTNFLKDINKLGTAFYDLKWLDKRVAIIGRNKYEWILTYITNLLGNIVSVPIDKDLQIDELEGSLIRSKADVVIFDAKYKEKIEEIKQKSNMQIEDYICMEKTDGYECITDLLQKGDALLKQGNNEYVNCKVDSEKMSILLFTSGTTAKAKAVMLSQKNVASNIYAMQLVEEIKSTDRNLAFLPYHHIFGSTGQIMMLASGANTSFPDGLRYIAQNLKEYKVTLFIGVPLLIEAIYNKIMKEIEKQGKRKTVKIAKCIANVLFKIKIDIRRKLFKQVIENLGGELRMVISGGAPLDAKIAKGFNELGILVIQGYGLTETSPVIAAEDIKHMKAGTIGRPMANVILELENKDENGVGEIKVKGPNVMIGYYENQEETNKVLKDGWFYTGDLAYIDKQGYIHISGRDKNMIVLKSGKKVFPEELETLVNRLDVVKECMVFGLPKGNDVKLSVKVVYDKEEVKEEYGDISEKDLHDKVWEQIKQINQTLPRYKYIKNMILTDEELIKNTTKKVKRQDEMKKILKV